MTSKRVEDWNKKSSMEATKTKKAKLRDLAWLIYFSVFILSIRVHQVG